MQGSVRQWARHIQVMKRIRSAELSPASERCTGMAGHPIRRVQQPKGHDVNNIIYIVGLIVVVIAVLSFFGLR